MNIEVMQNIKSQIVSTLEENLYSANKLIDVLKRIPLLREAYEKNASNIRGWTLEEHTVIALNQFDLYFSRVDLKGFLTKGFLRLCIALHDIGKPQASEIGYKHLQHKKSKEIFDEVSEIIPFTFTQKKLFYAVFLNDVLGKYLRSKVGLQKTSHQLLSSSEILNVDICNLLYINTIYYQCDVASYTLDALQSLQDKIGKKPLLDYIFYYDEFGRKVFNEEMKIIRFSSEVEARYRLLLEKIRCHENTK